MRLVTFAILGLLVVLPADAVREHRNDSSAPICDNNARCVAPGAVAPAPDNSGDRPALKHPPAPAQRHPRTFDANGNRAGFVVSHKTGAHARVGRAYAARFQAYIDDLETNYGARVLFMGGIRPGRCSPASEHPCGKALDVCQRRRGVVDPRCHLPGRATLGKIAASHGLFEGGRWCNSDYGHAQIDVTAAACGDRRIRVVNQ